MYPFIDLHILFLYICIYFDNVFLLIDMYIICTSYMYIYLSLPVTQDISIILFLFFFLEVYLYRRDLAEAVTFTGNLSFKDELILGLALDIIFRFIYQSIIKIISTSRFKSEPNSVPKFRQGPFIVSWRGPSYNWTKLYCSLLSLVSVSLSSLYLSFYLIYSITQPSINHNCNMCSYWSCIYDIPTQCLSLALYLSIYISPSVCVCLSFPTGSMFVSVYLSAPSLSVN